MDGGGASGGSWEKRWRGSVLGWSQEPGDRGRRGVSGSGERDQEMRDETGRSWEKWRS